MKNRIYQFKITMREIEPTIWRRILVPEKYNFWDLHVAIQDAMGWWDCHMHAFRMRRKHAQKITEIGIPIEPQFEDEPETLSGWKIPISLMFDDVGVTSEYEYDFGDFWIHDVLLEGILLREKGRTYPRCIGGARACPPEDCGGVPGYYDLLEIISDPKHEEHKQMLTWLGGSYDPGAFEPEMVKFDNPKKRWKIAFSQG
jgi:hypothetical protein